MDRNFYTRTPSSEHLREATRPTFRIPFVHSIALYVQGLSTSDRYITYILGIFVAITSLASLYALERSFLIEVPSYGGSLTEGIVGAPRFVNPLLAISDTDHDLAALTYAGLMGYDAQGNLVPILAQDYSVSDDGKTYTFTLREGETFSDGTPLTSDDVVYTIQKAQDPLLKSPVLSNWANIRVEATDVRTVTFILPSSYPSFLQNATLGILPARIWRTISDENFPFSPAMIVPVGAGPFQVSKITRDGSGEVTDYTLVPNGNFVLGKPYIGTMHFIVYGDRTALAAALKSRAVQSAYGVSQNTGALRAPYTQVFGVFFNASSEPLFKNIEVRQALSQAIDRRAIVENVLGGYGVSAYGPLPPTTLEQSTNTPFTTGIDAAKKTLTSKGWSFSTTTSTWTKAGQTLAFTLKTANVPELKGTAASMQADWAKLGVAVTIEYSAPTDIAQSVIRPRNYGALLFGEVTGSTPDLYAFWHSSQVADPGLNIARYSDKSVDTLLEKAHSATDPLVRAGAVTQASALISAAFPAAFAYTPEFIYSIPSNLSGVHLGTMTRPSDRFNGVWTWHVRSELVWPFLIHNRWL
jgi:peptide/nickel transport system substrate-binding protein